MKVLYFHQHFSIPKGSAGLRSYIMARRLVERGHQVTMVCGSYGPGRTGLNSPFVEGVRRGMVDGIDVIEIGLPYSNSDSYLKRTRLFLSFALRSLWPALSEDYDLVFATTTPLTAGLPAMLARWLRRKPFVFEVRDLWPELPRAMGVIRNPLALGMMSALEWLSYRSADRLVGLAPGIVDGIARRGVSRERIVMIPNACELAIFADFGVRWRPQGVAPEDLLAVFAGTQGVANGLDAVLNAAKVLKERGRADIKLLLIGQGGETPKLVARATREQLDNIVFHDPVEKQRLAQLFASSDLGLQVLANVPAFYYGTSPNKFFDYLAAGLPVLTNYPGWVADLVAQNRIGYAVPPDNPAAFADALEAAAANRNALPSMGARARALAAAQFSSTLLADRFVDWLQAAQGGRGRKQSAAPAL